MTNNIVTKYEVLKEAGAIFAAAITSDYVELKNFKYIDFIITSGVGTAADVTVTIKAKKGSAGTPAAVAFRKKTDATAYTNVAATGDTLSVGGVAGSCGVGVYRITADDIATAEYDRVAIDTTIVANSTIPGAIIAVKYEPRYSE